MLIKEKLTTLLKFITIKNNNTAYQQLVQGGLWNGSQSYCSLTATSAVAVQVAQSKIGDHSICFSSYQMLLDLFNP